MSSPEQLARRVDRTGEDLQAIADTAVDINTRVQAMQKTQRDHTTTLRDHTTILQGHTTMLMNVHGKVENVETGLATVQQVQHEQSNELAVIKTAVVEILRRLDQR